MCALLFVAAVGLSSCTSSTPEAAATPAADAAPTAVPTPTLTAQPVPTSTPEPPTSTPEPPTATPTPTPDYSVSGDFAVLWEPCAVGECGELTVPLDYDDPEGTKIRLPVARVAARDEALRIGSLFVNFGGPGGEGIPGLGGFAQGLPISVQDRFDIVTWNPRGTDGDALLSCPPPDELGALLYDAEDGFADDIEAEEARRRDWSNCTDVAGLLDNIGSVTTTRDLEALRQAVDDDALTYVGYSYGTQLGWMYATMFPDTVRALVLDAPLPPGRHSVEGWLLQMENFDKQFARMDGLCDLADDCAVADEGFAETFARLQAELDDSPMIAEDGRPVTSADLRRAAQTALYLSPATSGPLLAQAFEDLEQSDADLLRIFVDETFDYAAYDAVTCADGAGIETLDDLRRYIELRFERGDTFAASPDTVLCDTWPARTQPLPEINTGASPPILVIATTEDPATPYPGAVELTELMPNAVLLTHIGGGHGVVTDNACIDAHVETYLLSGLTPAADERCVEAQAVLGIGFSGDPDDHAGVAITVVGDGSAAQAAGVLTGDILISIDGTPIESFADLPILIGGVEALVTIERDGELLDLAITPIAPDWT